MCRLLYRHVMNRDRNLSDSFFEHFFMCSGRLRGQTRCFGMQGHLTFWDAWAENYLSSEPNSAMFPRSILKTLNITHPNNNNNNNKPIMQLSLSLSPHPNPNPQPSPQPHQLSTLLKILSECCNKLNSCLPQSQQVEINASVESIGQGLRKLVERVLGAVRGYEGVLQNLEEHLRKHIKNEIQLKLYYQHLEDIVVSLRKQKTDNIETITLLKTQLTVLKQKQKNYMTISNNNTRYGQDLQGHGQLQSKLDTIAKIKNRLSLNGTEEFYSSYLTKKVERERDTETRELRDKRESLANALKELYESPVENKEKSKSKSKEKDKEKEKQRQKQKSKPKSRQKQKQKSKGFKSTNTSKDNAHSTSYQSLSKARSRKSLANIQKEKEKEKDHRKPIKRPTRQQKDYLKGTFSAAASRRNSRI